MLVCFLLFAVLEFPDIFKLANGFQMRCLVVADLHYALPQFDWLVSAAPQFDLVTNVQKRTFPPGQSVEVVRGERDGVPFLLPWKPSAHSGGGVS